MKTHAWDPDIYGCAGYDDRYNHRKGCKRVRALRFDPVFKDFFYTVECGSTHQVKSIRERLVRCVPTDGKTRDA